MSPRKTRTWLCLIALAAGACQNGPGATQIASTANLPSAAVEPAVSRAAPPARAIHQVAHLQPERAATPNPRITTPKGRLQCVPYAREHSRIAIRGDAWTWWRQAEGRYQRGRVPAVGSVLVLKRKGASRGHLAVVSEIVSDREVITHHANWLNKGRIHIDTPVRDVSPGNDWSAVRVWYTPGKVLGKSTYPAYGFIYPQVATAAQ